MDILEAIYQRRAVRHYTADAVAPAMILELLAAAVQAPSPLNFQPWSFAVISGRSRLASYSTRVKEHLLLTLPPLFELHAYTERMNDPDYAVFHGAPALIVICAKPEGYAPAESCALAAQNLMLAAHAAGLGTCPIGFVRAWLREPSVKTELGIPGTHQPVFPLVVGHPTAPPARVPRREPDIVAWLQSPTGPA
jgi:nitroreductase